MTAAPPADRLAALLEGRRARLPGAGLPWLEQARTAALEAFRAQGLPHARFEGWRRTPADALTKVEYEPAGRPKALGGFGGRALCPVDFHRVVLHNGRLRAESSRVAGLPHGVTVTGLADALRDEPEAVKTALTRGFGRDGLPLAALAEALFEDGVVVRVARHARIDRPLHLLLASDDSETGRPQAAHLRVLLLLEDGASLDLVEESVGGGAAPFWTNLLAQAWLGEGASLTHYRLQRESGRGALTSATLVEAGRSARYAAHSFAFGGALARSDLRVRLAGEGAECALNGLALVRGDEIVDHHAVVEHAAVGGTTRALFKSVLDDRGRSVFEGLVDVRPGAQKTDASVYSKNLLLSEDAFVHADPEFKILADDVSCKHGGAMGQLSPEATFYLRSRGIGAEEARRMLVYAFGSEMIGRVGLSPLRDALAAELRSRRAEETTR